MVKKNVSKDYYAEFIAYVRDRPNPKQRMLYKHRVLPGHSGGTYASENRPEQRSEAGKLGAKAQQVVMKAAKKGFYSEKPYIQRLGNLKRWGIKINGERIPFKKLSADFIHYHCTFGPQAE